MATDGSIKTTSVVFCSCAYFDVIPEVLKTRVFASLRQAGIEVEAVADLCGMAAQGDPRLRRWAQAESLAIVACYPRAVRWLFEAAGISLEADKVRFFNMRVQSPDEILEALLEDGAPKGSCDSELPRKEEGWVPWFPVIDYDRCKNCKQCMNFCLFGVYGLSPEGQVQVQNPSGCKTNCPACARMCPAQAIIFPKYGEAPINGDEAAPPVESEEKPAPDLRRLLQGDVYDRIRGRQPGRKRFSTEPKGPSSGQPASSLEGLRRELDIPYDVLTSLSPAELQRIKKTSRSDDAEASEGDESK